MTLHKELCESAKMVQEKIKLYYNKKRSKRPDLKKGDKMWLPGLPINQQGFNIELN